MSRSRRKTPICGITTAESDKPGKVADHRRLRRRNRQRVAHGMEPLHEREVSDPWGWPKDGKAYYPRDPRVMRK